MNIPNAVLFDGGDSTQLACLDKTGRMFYLDSGAPVSIPLGSLNARPLRALLPLEPASLQHHGVLNYLYLEGPP